MKKISCDFLIITHRLYLQNEVKFGGLDRTKEYLLEKGHTIGLVEHPLTTYGPETSGGYQTYLSIQTRKGIQRISSFKVFPGKHPFRWLTEALFTVYSIQKYFDKGYTVLSGDPLSGYTAIKLKKKKYAKKIFLHCTDYAKKRFSFSLLNKLYQFIYLRNFKNSDAIFCVSSRMTKYFNGLYPHQEYINFPNSPEISKTPFLEIKKRIKNQIVLSGISIKGMNHLLLINAMKTICSNFQDARLVIIGAGGGEKLIQELGKKAGISNKIIIKGFLPRQEALKVISESYIGIVLYNEYETFNYFRDSIKIREYTACGLPVLCDDSTATGQEAYDAGAAFLIINENEFIDKFIKLQDKETYIKISQASYEFAIKNDKKILLDNIYKKIIAD